MTTREMIEVMEAYDRGEKIQIRGLYQKKDEDWYDSCNPSWAWDEWGYRVKPKEECRPFTYEEAIKHLGEIVVRQDNNGTTCKLITAVHKYGDEVQINGISASMFMNQYKFYDGSPCGVRV